MLTFAILQQQNHRDLYGLLLGEINRVDISALLDTTHSRAASMSRTWKMMCFLVLLSLCLVGFVDAGAEVANNCPVSIWCAIVMGYDPTDQTPVNERLAVSWVSQNPGQVLSSNFADHAQNTSMAMMCTRDPGANKPLVTQLEYTWMRDLGQTYFDVSNVEGEPFADEGFIMTVKDPKTPLFNTCYGAHCEAGDTSCNQVYEKSNDDFQGMRTCSDSVDILLTLCSG